MLTDEATFTVTGNRGEGVDEGSHGNPVKHPESVKELGDFGAHGTGKPVVLPRNVTVNEDGCLELLAERLEDCFDRCQFNVFQQDGAPAYTSKLIKDCLN